MTDIKRAQRQAEENGARFRSLFENSFDAVLLTKPDGSILSANPAAQSMLDMTEEEIVRKGRNGLIVEDGSWESAIQERKRTGKLLAEFTFKRKNGTTFVGEVTSALFTDADGSTKTSMFIRDITERRNADDSIRRQQAVLEGINRILHETIAVDTEGTSRSFA